MGQMRGFEPPYTGTTIRGLRPLGDTCHRLGILLYNGR